VEPPIGVPPGDAQLQLQFDLMPNYPNPFNPLTTITYSIAKPGLVNLSIYDVRGRLLRTLVKEAKTAGEYTTTWDSRNAGGMAVASGVYLVSLDMGGQVKTRKIALLK
jgi:flagellar hook assembly protein FlgD